MAFTRRHSAPCNPTRTTRSAAKSSSCCRRCRATCARLPRSLLVRRREWSQQFVTAVDAGMVSAKSIPLPTLRKLLLHRDEQIAKLVKKHWGEVKGATTAEMRQGNRSPRCRRPRLARETRIPARSCSPRNVRTLPRPARQRRQCRPRPDAVQARRRT